MQNSERQLFINKNLFILYEDIKFYVVGHQNKLLFKLK